MEMKIKRLNTGQDIIDFIEANSLQDASLIDADIHDTRHKVGYIENIYGEIVFVADEEDYD